jgi:hypothetical protein
MPSMFLVELGDNLAAKFYFILFRTEDIEFKRQYFFFLFQAYLNRKFVALREIIVLCQWRCSNTPQILHNPLCPGCMK